MTLDVFNQRLIYCASMNLLDDLKNLLERNAIFYRNKKNDENIDDCITRLLSMGDYDKRTPLHLAAAEGHVEMLNYLLSKNIDSAPKDRWGNTPFFEATKCLNEVDNAEKRAHYLEIVSILSSMSITSQKFNSFKSNISSSNSDGDEKDKEKDKNNFLKNDKDLSNSVHSYETPTTVTAVK